MQETSIYEPETYRPSGKLSDVSPEPPTHARPVMKKASLALYCAIPVVLGIFVLYVWPTPYETYLRNGATLRIDRFTGATQTLQATGWVPASYQAPQALGDDLLGSISVNESLITRGTLHASIYNGTNERLNSVTLFLTILNKDRTVKMERTYLSHPEDAGNGGAYGDSGFGARCSVPLGPGETYRLAIAGASGAVTPGLAAVQVMASSRVAQTAPLPSAQVTPVKKPVAPAAIKVPKPIAIIAAAPPRPVHSMPLTAGVTPPHTVPPFQSAIAAPRSQPLPKTPSAVSPSVLSDPVKTAGLTPLQISNLQQRYDTFKRDGEFESNPKDQAWSLAALARNIVHDDHKPDLGKVPTSVLEDSLHMINTYKPEDFLR